MQKKERNMGIELLRIICMMCMIVQHIIGHGWIIQSLHEGTWKYDLVIALRSWCTCGINCFALISGYVGVRARYKYSSIVLQWSKMWVYSVFFTLLASVVFPGTISSKAWIQAIFPTLHGLFWYFSAYMACYAIAPMIRIAMRRMTFKQASVSLGIMFVMFSLLSHSFGKDAFYVGSGKNTIWLIILYIYGAYFGWFKPHENVSKWILGCFVVITSASAVLTQPVAQRLGIAQLSGDLYWSSTLRMLALAVALLLFFSRVEVKRGKKLVAWLGGASFGVYVLHEQPQIRYYTISKHAYRLTELGNVEIVIGIILASAVMYLACALIDALREKIYRALRVRQRLEVLEERLLGDLWAD